MEKQRGKGIGLREIGPRCQGPGCVRSLKTCNEITDEERQIIFRLLAEFVMGTKKCI